MRINNNNEIMSYINKKIFFWTLKKKFYSHGSIWNTFIIKFFFANFFQTHGSNWDTFFKKNFPCKYKKYFYVAIKKFSSQKKRNFLAPIKKKKKFPATVRKFLCNNKNFFTIIKKITKIKIKKKGQ